MSTPLDNRHESESSSSDDPAANPHDTLPVWVSRHRFHYTFDNYKRHTLLSERMGVSALLGLKAVR